MTAHVHLTMHPYQRLEENPLDVGLPDRPHCFQGARRVNDGDVTMPCRALVTSRPGAPAEFEQGSDPTSVFSSVLTAVGP